MASGEVSPSSGSSWSREQEKAFEIALATYDENSSDRWEKIASDVPGKTVEEIKHHFELLVEDIDGIESGHVPLPCYISSLEKSADQGNDAIATKKSRSSGLQHGDSRSGGKGSRSDIERRKGTAWTEDEHRLFLLGLEKYGKGDWRSISRNFVITRTPTQVASHAQKYFIRLNSMNKDRRRTSIHDITTIGGGELSAPQGPITGQTNGTVAPPMKSSKPSHQLSRTSGPGVYGTPAIGQPIGGPIVSAEGTPVEFPAAPHMVYGVHTAFPGTSVSGAPFGTPEMVYPVMHTSAQR